MAHAAQKLAPGLRERRLVEGEHRFEAAPLLEPLAEQLLGGLRLALEEPGEDAHRTLPRQAGEQAPRVAVRGADRLRERRERPGGALEGGGEAHRRVSSSTHAR